MDRPFLNHAVANSADGKNDFLESHIHRQKQMETLSNLMSLAATANTTTAPAHHHPAAVDDGFFYYEDNKKNNNSKEDAEVVVLRNLTRSEIQTMEGSTSRCTSSDWSKVQLLVRRKERHIDQSLTLQGLVSDTRFEGVVVLVMLLEESKGVTTTSKMEQQNDWNKLPLGIHANSLISDSILHVASCRVYRNIMVSNTFVSSNAMLINCGLINYSGSHDDIEELVIEVGAESGGGRTLSLTAEDTMIEVCHQLRGGGLGGNEKLQLRALHNVLSSGCVVRDTPTVQNIYLSSCSSINGATSVRNVVLLPGAVVGNSCTVSNVFLQWNASIMDHSTVSDALLMEQAHCGPQSIVATSVLGPDVHVSAGEIHASVIGPNTNSHHQSLLIGVLWPMGRGNVGYGANVGSNHTGRIPDQETAAGEGTFWGLSCVIKFPVDLTHAPYSIVAAGTNLPPQRVCMPFSLIMEGGGGQNKTGGKNEIIPGWVLQSSPYTLARSEVKFATRRKAKRHDFYTGWRIFRPETIELCRIARAALIKGKRQGGGDAKKENTQGIGSNVLTSRGRQVGIRAYSECLRRYALHGLLHWILLRTKERDGGVQLLVDPNRFMTEFWGSMNPTKRLPDVDKATKSMDQVDWPLFPWEASNYFGKTEWEYQRLLLIDECQFPTIINEEASSSRGIFPWVVERLQELVALENDHASRVFKCKKRDDIRGAHTIPGYSNSHVPAEQDPVIVQARKDVTHTQEAVEGIIKDMSLNSARSKL